MPWFSPISDHDRSSPHGQDGKTSGRIWVPTPLQEHTLKYTKNIAQEHTSTCQMAPQAREQTLNTWAFGRHWLSNTQVVPEVQRSSQYSYNVREEQHDKCLSDDSSLMPCNLINGWHHAFLVTKQNYWPLAFSLERGEEGQGLLFNHTSDFSSPIKT